MSRPQLSRQQTISQLAGRKPGLAPGGFGLHVPREKGLLGVLVLVNRDHCGPCPEPTAYPEPLCLSLIRKGTAGPRIQHPSLASRV